MKDDFPKTKQEFVKQEIKRILQGVDVSLFEKSTFMGMKISDFDDDMFKPLLAWYLKIDGDFWSRNEDEK